MELLPGMFGEKTIVVEERHIASHLGSGGVPVYSTPTMILHMEETSRDLVDGHLGPRGATVGASIDVRHLAPTPLGAKVRIRSELVSMEGRTLTFKLEAWDEVDKIGEGDHVRVVIDLDRFEAKLAGKRAALGLEGAGVSGRK